MNIIELAKQSDMIYREFEDEFANAYADGVYLKTLEAFAALVAAAARADEREECAKVCEEDGLLWGQRYAAAIRARGTT